MPSARLPEISNAIHLCSVQIEQGIDSALRREVEHILSGEGDYDSDYSSHAPAIFTAGSSFKHKGSSHHPPNKKTLDKLRRQYKRTQYSTQYPSAPRFSLSQKHRAIKSSSVKLDLHQLPATTGAFVSQPQPCKNPHEWTLDQLVVSGFKVVEWDGSTPTAITDEQDRIITVLAGRPQGNDWDTVHGHMSELLHKVGIEVGDGRKERRGHFISLSTGVSFGGGQATPRNLAHRQGDGEIIDKLCTDSRFIRAAGFMSGCFAFYAPKLYQEYADKLSELFSKYTHFKKPFEKSVFPTCTFNCGPRVVTLEHIDNNNVPYGLCAIFALGLYDHTKGGHLVLFDLGLAVQFPPGSTILVPSGTIRHGNTAIQPYESRQSFTQYCPGGLLRWVAYGFRPVKSSPAELKRHFEETHQQRCIHAVGLFSKLHELHDDRVRVFSLKNSR